MYDPDTGDIISETTTPVLSKHNKLYAALRLALKDKALTTMDGYTHLHRGYGVELLRAMIPIYHPDWSSTTKLHQHSLFLKTRRLKTETVDDYATSLLSELQDLSWNGIVIPEVMLNQIFIAGLGPEFSSLHELTNTADYPVEFRTDKFEALVEASRKYLTNITTVREENKVWREGGQQTHSKH